MLCCRQRWMEALLHAVRSSSWEEKSSAGHSMRTLLLLSNRIPLELL